MAIRIRQILNRRMMIIFFMGFSSGLPLLLVGQTLKAWMTVENVNLTLVGIFSAVQLPYSFKFLWSPVLDRYSLFGLGRRRGWLLLTQILLAGSLTAMGFVRPENATGLLALLAVITAFLSATQDIAIDAFRREFLEDHEMGLGSSYTSVGYRIGMFVASTVAMNLAAFTHSWTVVYMSMAACMSVGLITTLLAPEPVVSSPPRNLRKAFAEPLMEFFRRRGAIILLVFIVLYKLGESLASQLYTPFYLKIGFSLEQVANVAKIVGIWATIAGGVAGGILLLQMGIKRALLLFGVMQGVALLGFSILATVGPNIWVLAMVVALECFTSGMAASAFGAFLSLQCDKRYTATQFALFSSIVVAPANILGSGTGWAASHLGWANFFLVCTLITIPGLLLIPIANKYALNTD